MGRLVWTSSRHKAFSDTGGIDNCTEPGERDVIDWCNLGITTTTPLVLMSVNREVVLFLRLN